MSKDDAARRPRPRKGVRVEKLDDGVVLQGKKDPSVHVLNMTAARIWELCDGKHTVKSIAKDVTKGTATRYRDALADVERVIGELRQQKLLK